MLTHRDYETVAGERAWRKHKKRFYVFVSGTKWCVSFSDAKTTDVKTQENDVTSSTQVKAKSEKDCDKAKPSKKECDDAKKHASKDCDKKKVAAKKEDCDKEKVTTEKKAVPDKSKSPESDGDKK